MKMRMSLLAVIPLLAIPAELRSQADMYDGKPTFAEGTDLAYYVWRDGNSWHLRWTTQGAARRFTGSVNSDGGKLKSLKRIDVEKETKVLYPGRAGRVWVGPRGRAHVGPGRAPVTATREQDHMEMDGDNTILFNALTVGDIDGFDFKVEEKAESLKFNLNINGEPRPLLVQIGKENQKPRQLPLVVRLK